MRHHAIAIGELARRTGCNIETIRYYERIGLLPVPERKGRYRSYGAEDVGRLGFVRRARQLGFSLDQVRALLALASGGTDVCAEVRELATVHLADVRTRIADLRAMERILADAIRQCAAGEAPACPLIGALSHGSRNKAVACRRADRSRREGFGPGFNPGPRSSPRCGCAPPAGRPPRCRAGGS